MPPAPLIPESPAPAVFLDRDDTLIHNADLPADAFPETPGDLYLPEHVRLMPGVLDACTRLADAGYTLVVVTNQGCVARGSASIADVEATNDRLRSLLTVDGRPLLAAVYAAPHHPEAVVDHLRADHPWRKPGPGMILAAARELHLDLARSWLVGDAERDIEAGINAGIAPNRCLRVGGGGIDNLAAAADLILDRPNRAPRPAAASTITLTAAGAPLADRDTRRTVEAAARAIAERTGVPLIALQLDDHSVTATLAAHRLAAMGFMAELRRTTNDWYAHRHGGRPLWPQTDPPAGDPDDRA